MNSSVLIIHLKVQSGANARDAGRNMMKSELTTAVVKLALLVKHKYEHICEIFAWEALASMVILNL